MNIRYTSAFWIYCDHSSLQVMDWGWYRGSGEELMLLKGRDVKRCRDGGRMVYGGGASTSSDKEVS